MQMDAVFLTFKEGTSKKGKDYRVLTCATLTGDVITLFPDSSVPILAGSFEPFCNVILDYDIVPFGSNLSMSLNTISRKGVK